MGYDIFRGIDNYFDAENHGYKHPNRFNLKPGDKVYAYDTYLEVAPIEPYTVAKATEESVIVEVKSENRNCYFDITGWFGREKPDVMKRYGLSGDKRYWFFDYVKPTTGGRQIFIDNE